MAMDGGFSDAVATAGRYWVGGAPRIVAAASICCWLAPHVSFTLAHNEILADRTSGWAVGGQGSRGDTSTLASCSVYLTCSKAHW